MKARFFALAALVLGLASCQQEFSGVTPVGGEVDFQIGVSAPEFGTRADQDGRNGHSSTYGAIDYLSEAEWENVDLRYTLEIYDAKGLDKAPVKDRMVKVLDKYEPVVFDLRLVPNRDYQFVIFADFVTEGATELPTVEAQADLGLHHTIGATLQDITLKADAINTELTDAYFASESIRVSNSAAQDIVLRRPYGKVRVIATDLHELNLNVNPQSVTVVYDAFHPMAFNAVTGAIGGEYETKEYSYTYADLFKEVEEGGLKNHYYTSGYDEYKKENIDVNANGVERHKYMTLFTDYILANPEQESIHFTMTVNDKAGNEIKTTQFYTDIPVERNHLTTIIGNVLTTATEINVTIDDNFEGYHNIEMVYVSSFRELYEAVNNYKQGQIINFEADIVDDDTERDIVILQQEGVNVVINGDNHKFDGTITINGNARANGAETVLLQNIKFETERSEVDFISAPTKMNGKYNYSHNVTVKDCTFESKQYNEKVVGIKLLTTYNAVIKNVSAKNMHSLAQFQSTDNETVIEDAKVENCKNGISLGNMALATIKNVEIAAKGYGIRLDGEKTRTVAATIENAKISAYIPVNIRKMNDDAVNVEVKFVDNAEYLEGTEYEIAFCSNEYEEGVAPVAPVGTFTLQNAEEARAYYGDVTSFSALDAAINSTNDPTVTAKANITKIGEGIEVERDVILDFEGYEYNAGSTASSTWYAIEASGEYDVVLKNANFTRAGVHADNGANVVFKNGTINHKPERTSRYIFCARSGATITIKDGTFTNDRAKNSFFWADAATIIVEGGTYTSVYGVKSNNKIVTSNGGQVIIKAGTFEFDPTAWVVATSVVEKVGSNWVVTPVTPSNDIADAISNVEDGGKIVLTDGAYNMPAVNGKDVTIVGSKDVVITVNKPNMNGSNVTFEGVTVKGSGYATGVQHVNTVTYNNVKVIGEMCLYGEAVTFNNCEFELNSQYIWTYGCKKSTFENCVFNTNGKAILVYNEGAGACEVAVNGCTFNATAGAKAGAIANQNCAAIEIDNFQSSGVGAAHKVTASNNTYNSNFSGEWRIKNYVAGNAITVNGAEYTQIAVDGKLMTIDADKNVTIIE